MPTLTRILIFVALIGALVYAAMFSLAHFVEPTVSEITIDIPASKLNPQPIAPDAPPAPPAPANPAEGQ